MSSTYHRTPIPPLSEPSLSSLSEAVAIAVLQERSVANQAAIQNIYSVHAKAEDACNARFAGVQVRETVTETRVNDLNHHVKNLYSMVGDVKAGQATAGASQKEFRDSLQALWTWKDRIDQRDGFVTQHGLKLLIGVALFLTLLPSGSVKTAFLTMFAK